MSGLTNEQVEKAEIESENLIHLLKKYGIAFDAEKTWLRLALALARDKIDGFSDDLLKHKKIGRPSKNNRNALTEFLPKKAKKRGAPKKPKLDPEWIDQIKLKHGLTGRGADKKALEILAAEYFKPAHRKSEVNYLQKRLSEARKLARANSKK